MKKSVEYLSREEIEDIEKTLFVTVLVTQHCNFRCWYCDVVDFDRPHRMMTVDEFSKVIEFIDKQDISNVTIRFYGGEPFVNKNITTFVGMVRARLAHRNVHMIANTNLTASTVVYENCGDVMLAPSFHSEWVDDVGYWFHKCMSLDNIHHVILMLQENNQRLIEELHYEYKDRLPLLVVPIDQFIDTKEYREFRKRNEHMCFDDSEHRLYFGEKQRTLMCSSGLIIDEDGSLYYCWNRADHPIINVFNETKKLSKWHICNGYGDDCDHEIIRCSLSYYSENIANKVYDGRPNRKVLFRCNA